MGLDVIGAVLIASGLGLAIKGFLYCCHIHNQPGPFAGFSQKKQAPIVVRNKANISKVINRTGDIRGRV